jgi:hypothetical protein
MLTYYLAPNGFQDHGEGFKITWIVCLSCSSMMLEESMRGHLKVDVALPPYDTAVRHVTSL